MSGRPQSLSKGQKEEVIRILRGKIWKWILIGLPILTCITGLSLWGIWKRIHQNMESLVAQQFEEPRIQQVVNEVASEYASSMMLEQIQPEVDRFRYDVDQQISNLQSVIDSTWQLAAPPTLALREHTVTQYDDCIVALLRFEPSKNQPLGSISFQIDIIEPTNVQILDIWPDVGSHAFGSGENSKQINENRASARLTYAILGVGWPTIELTLTSPAEVMITGNHILEPIIVEIDNPTEQTALLE